MMKKVMIIGAVIFLFGASYVRADNWTVIDYPGGHDTAVFGISGNTLVGAYSDVSNNGHGFIYDGTNWKTLDVPGPYGTSVTGISGNNIVGTYGDASNHEHGFLYNGTSWTAIDAPGALNTQVQGISGSEIFGYYWDSGNSTNINGFIYNMADSSWINYDYPGAQDTRLNGINGNNLVGYYTDTSGFAHSFLYDGTNWVTLNVPGNATGISGSYIVGSDPAFIYDGTTFTTLRAPGSIGTWIWGIDGSTVVGEYESNDGPDHGFVYEIPEPCTLLLLGLGSLLLRKGRV